MTIELSSSIHSITAHLREAADQVQLANYRILGDRWEVIELGGVGVCDTFGALDLLMLRLPQLIGRMHHIIARADDSLYETEGGDPAADALSSAELMLDVAFTAMCAVSNNISEACRILDRLRIHDPDSTSVV
jgi:hypothetical protein